MNASKFLVPTVAAITVVAAASFAYAQTSTNPSAPPNSSPQTQTDTSVTNQSPQAAPTRQNQRLNDSTSPRTSSQSTQTDRDTMNNSNMNSGSMNNSTGMNNNSTMGMSNSGTSGATGMASDSSTMPTERMAKVGRHRAQGYRSMASVQPFMPGAGRSAIGEGIRQGLLVGAACLAIAIPAAVHSDPPANSPVAAGVHRTPDGMARASARFADFGTVKLSPRRTPRGRQGGRFK